MTPTNAALLALLLVGAALGTGSALGWALRRWNRSAFAVLVELVLVGGAAVGLAGAGTVGGARALGANWTLEPAELTSGPWLVAGMFATAAGELLIVVAGWIARHPERPNPAPWAKIFAWCAAGLALGPALLLLGGAWGLALEQLGYSPEPQQVAEALLREQGWVQACAMIFVALLAPVLEEFVFRGWLLPLVGRGLSWLRHGRSVALVATSLGFASMHADAPWALPPLFIIGFVCGWLRFRSGSTWPGVLAHMGNNGIALAVVVGGGAAILPP